MRIASWKARLAHEQGTCSPASTPVSINWIRQAWNALEGTDVPFLRHEFLAALEHTGCVGPGTGWTPLYITLHDDTGLAAAAPAFIKTHSFGEFVFDFSWAEAYAHFGRYYYPKLSVCVPFTPGHRRAAAGAAGPGRRCWCAAGWPGPSRSSSPTSACPRRTPCSSMSRPARRSSRPGGCCGGTASFTGRTRDYGDFEQYLATFTAEKRKKARRERRRVQEAGIHFETRFGADIGESLLDTVYAFTAAPSCATAMSRTCRASSSAKSRAPWVRR